MKNQLILNVGLIFFFLYAVTLKAQTPTENYIQSKTYLDYNVSGQPTKTAETVEYFDGLGRPKQVVNVKASPLGKDVVTHIEYDEFGRQIFDFLPVPQAGTLNGGIVPSSLANATQPHIYGSEKIFSEKVLENSPLDRIQQQIQVGNAWNSKPITFGYDAVTTADAVKKFSTSTTWENGATKSIPSNNGIYLDGQLYKNTVTDEDGNKTIEFKNGRGQLILLRKVVSASENADTYYVYNEYDQLAFIVPPLLSKIQSWSQTDQNNLAYEYRYDGRNRPVEKKLPGKGWEYMVYDKADRLILTQDANMRISGNWLMTKYDQFGRVAYTGTLKDSSSRSNLQNQIANLIIYDARDQTGIVRNGITLYYTNVYFSVDTLLSVNYYDTYPPYSFNPSVSSVFGEPVLTGNVTDGKSTKGLPVMSFIKNIEDNSWTKNYTYYDTRGRVVSTYSINHLGGYTQTESKLDFAGVAQTVVTRHKRLASDPEKVITENFTYDHQNRLLKHYHQVDQLPQELLADNTYNEIGQLVNKKTGNTSGTPLQSVDYQYNIRGWLTKVNNPADLGGKLFGYALKYENPEHAADAPAKYNGNISEFDWRTSSGNFLRRYAYKYDALNRLKDASYREPTATAPVSDGYSEFLTYDLNGNIQTLKRFQALNNIPILIDDLKYKLYEGNRLKLVLDANTNPSGYPAGGNIISYDLNGNMTNHIDKGIKKIGYNYLNLPQTVLFGGKDKLQFLYRADGTKLKKTFTYFVPQTGMILTQHTDYLDGFQYEQEPAGMPPLLQFFPTAEGYFDFQKKRYIYNYEDHVGNIRLAYYRGSNNEAIIDRETNYYPFGMEYIGFNGSQLQSYKYGFQGQERQAETGWSSFKWRNSIPELGRFFNIDPLAEDYATWSTYAFSGNRVVDARELEGLEPVSTKREQDLPGNEMEFAEFIGGAINSVRAAFSNNVVRTINTVTNDAISNKYEVNSSGQLVLVTGVPKESFKEKVVNGSFDLATLALAAAGGPEGVLTAQGGKAPIIKGIEEVKSLAKAGRSGKQARLRVLGDDPKVSSFNRGWIKNEKRHIKTGNRKTIRNPRNSRNSKERGTELAHPRKKRAKDGNGYEEAKLQDVDLHKLEHKYGGYK